MHKLGFLDPRYEHAGVTGDRHARVPVAGIQKSE
jgi:hypothetical protein